MTLLWGCALPLMALAQQNKPLTHASCQTYLWTEWSRNSLRCFPTRSEHVPYIDVARLKLRERDCQETARPFAVLVLRILGDFACSAMSYYVKQSSGLFDSCAPR